MHLLYALLVLCLLALALSVWACLTAEEGYEDEEGFHPVKSREELEASQEEERGRGTGNAPVPPFLSPQ